MPMRVTSFRVQRYVIMLIKAKNAFKSCTKCCTMFPKDGLFRQNAKEKLS